MRGGEGLAVAIDVRETGRSMVVSEREVVRGRVCCVSTASRMLLRAGTQGGWYLLGERRADDAAVACS